MIIADVTPMQFEYVANFNNILNDDEADPSANDPGQVIARYMLSAADINDRDGNRLLWLTCNQPAPLTVVPISLFAWLL